MNTAEGVENALIFERFIHAVIDRKNRFGFDGIEHVANVVGRGRVFDLEQGLRITLSLIVLHGLLMSQERGTLREEHREGAKADRLHGVLGIGSGTLVAQPGQAGAKFVDELIESFQAHAQSLARKSALSGYRKMSLTGTLRVACTSLRLRPAVAPTCVQPAAR